MTIIYSVQQEGFSTGGAHAKIGTWSSSGRCLNTSKIKKYIKEGCIWPLTCMLSSYWGSSLNNVEAAGTISSWQWRQCAFYRMLYQACVCKPNPVEQTCMQARQPWYHIAANLKLTPLPRSQKYECITKIKTEKPVANLNQIESYLVLNKLSWRSCIFKVPSPIFQNWGFICMLRIFTHQV